MAYQTTASGLQYDDVTPGSGDEARAGQHVRVHAIEDRAQFEALLETFVRRIDERDEKLLGMLADGPHALEALVARRLLYPPGYEATFVEDAERRSIAQHLDVLLEAGRVVRDDDGRWRLR